MRWFEVALVVLSVLTGVVWLSFRLFGARKRRARRLPIKEPVLVEYARAFFPVLFLVLLLRGFVAEPFRIPSNSMMPTLLTGDFILVNKFSYGLRLPVTKQKILDIGEPERGDVAVFRPPHHPDQDWIKRIVGLPGDEIAYRDHQLYINGQLVLAMTVGFYTGNGSGREMTGARLLREDLNGTWHRILQRGGGLLFVRGEGSWTVPEGHYFVMGDNRDNSEDSRYWGVLPEENLVGKAFLIWMNWDSEAGGVDFSRIGDSIR